MNKNILIILSIIFMISCNNPLEKGPPGGPPGLGGVAERGVAFNGVRFDAPAPVDAILGAYTLAPLDDAGGHINLLAGYHYHAATGLTHKHLQDNHEAQIGYAMDGFGIYEQLDSSGNETTSETVINETIIDVDPNLFLTEGLVASITTETRTLSNGEQASCYKIITKNIPTDHEMGPWCPSHITNDASLGGIWMEYGEIHDVDGAFVENMHIFYSDDTWMMYDDDGNIYVTDTEQECRDAANPNVGPEYQNFCVECLPSYVTDLTHTYYIPITPQALTPVSFESALDDCGGHYDEIRGYHYHVAAAGSNSFFGCSGDNPFKGAYAN